MKSVDPLLAFNECRSERISLVTTVDSDNKANIMAVALNMKASLNPAMVVISVHKSRYSSKLISESKEFVVAMANDSLRTAVEYVGTKSGSYYDKIRDLQLRTREASMIRPPLLEDATFNFECKLTGQITAADHVLFVGEVVAAHVSDPSCGFLLYMPDEDNKLAFQTVL